MLEGEPSILLWDIPNWVTTAQGLISAEGTTMSRLLMLCLCVAGAGAAVKAHPQDQLRASVAVRPPNLEVTNRDSFLWTDCDITINMGRFGGGGWSRDVSAIAPRRVTRLPISSFTNRSRERFNSNTHVAERISGTCDIDGRGLMFFDFTLSR